jgi:hypothetical protein
MSIDNLVLLLQTYYQVNTKHPVPSALEFRVFDLYALRNVQVVTGWVQIRNCSYLTQMAGGLSQLREIRSINRYYGAFSLESNAQLTGGLQAVFPALPFGSVQLGSVVNNPNFCDDSDTRFHLQSNAPAAQCGCTDTLALNIMNMTSGTPINVPGAAPIPGVSLTYYDDGSCEGPTCSSCITGTTGTCAFRLNNGDNLCVVAVNGICPPLANGSGTQACDLCVGVVCNEPPSCFNASSGVCSNTSGLCVYSAYLPAGSQCNDGNPSTGKSGASLFHLAYEFNSHLVAPYVSLVVCTNVCLCGLERGKWYGLY